MVKSLVRKDKSIRWSVNVNRLIKHRFKINEKALPAWQKFRDLFSAPDANVNFYLFQLHPRIAPEFAVAIKKISKDKRSSKKVPLEIINQEWVSWASRLGTTWLSVDSPNFPLGVYNTDRGLP
jgi:uncharacterized protein YecE (DUF72 family)